MTRPSNTAGMLPPSGRTSAIRIAVKIAIWIQPFAVVVTSGFSEFLGSQQREDQVKEHAEGDHAAKDQFEGHGKLTAGRRRTGTGRQRQKSRARRRETRYRALLVPSKGPDYRVSPPMDAMQPSRQSQASGRASSSST